MIENYKQTIEALYKAGIVPVIQLKQAAKAEYLAEALLKGNIRLAEVTFRTAGAKKVIRAMRSYDKRMLVGAGTVLTVDQAMEAEAAGAHFIVSPGFNAVVVEYCLKKGIPVFPGCVTPTEIERAISYGLKVLKFFPAEQYGGVETIKALSAPYQGISFMPTGGISLDNLGSYLKNKAVVACGGSFMVKADMLEANLWEEVSAQCAKATAIVKEARR